MKTMKPRMRQGRRKVMVAGLAGTAGALVTASLAWACAPSVDGQIFFEPIPRVIECGATCPTVEIRGASGLTSPGTGLTVTQQRSVYQDMTAWRAELVGGFGGPLTSPVCWPDDTVIANGTITVTTRPNVGTTFVGQATPQVSSSHPANATRFYQICSGFEPGKIRAMLGVTKI